MEAALQKNYPNDHLAVGSGQWMLVAEGTAKEISDKLGISDGTAGSGVIVSTSGYFGRAESNVWEWLTAKMRSAANG